MNAMPKNLLFSDYLNANAISKSSLDLIDRSPAHYKYSLDNPASRIETPAMRFGSIIHKAVLEPDTFYDEYIVMPEGVKKPTEAQLRAAKPSPKTVDQIELWNDFQSIAEGKALISEKEVVQAEGIRNAVFSHSKAKAILSNGIPEQSIFWNESITGEKCKARADWIHGSEQSLLVDLKTTVDARLHSFRSSIRKFRYNVQASHYSEGFGVDAFCFIAVEKEPPHGVAVYVLSPEQFSQGTELRNNNLETYAECKSKDIWPCYSEEILTI